MWTIRKKWQAIAGDTCNRPRGRMEGYRRKKQWFILWLGFVLTITYAAPSCAENVEENSKNAGRWVYQTVHGPVSNTGDEAEKDGAWYRLNASGMADTGWIYVDGYWYFLNTGEGAGKGRMMTGWQWIDGKCYYLAEICSDLYPMGALYLEGKTPDGYFVGTSGAWLNEHGEEWYVADKGLMSSETMAGDKKAGAAAGGKGSVEAEVREEAVRGKAVREEAAPQQAGIKKITMETNGRKRKMGRVTSPKIRGTRITRIRMMIRLEKMSQVQKINLRTLQPRLKQKWFPGKCVLLRRQIQTEK